MLNNQNVTPGEYFYGLPHWRAAEGRPVMVGAGEAGGLVVRFPHGGSTPVGEMPALAYYRTREEHEAAKSSEGDKYLAGLRAWNRAQGIGRGKRKRRGN